MAEQLRKAILLGQLPAGTRLVQSELSEALNVSVTPIREALRELSTQGLVDLDAFRGAIVHMPSLEELEELYEMRSLLIPLSVNRAIARLTESELKPFEALLIKMEAETDQTRWVELNRQFHNLLDDLGQTSQIRHVLQRLSDLSAIYVNLSFSIVPLQKEDSEQEHRVILQAYLNRDAEAATRLTLLHLNATLEAARDALTRSPISAK
ncbi:GntR family transcriptional regulator [Romeria aff. gracilis LEGE 07310]|uniref:GntR family transcriptional regulator n=1 Tax=Vasconcelosia minhoensis LEGE 07310 TaxID=915328 RepID=A0A8J7DPZ2_9CYAN|nr:GntR family transcriptional regulator [Romeria gracilis]MBE9080540.1 GntR family transcriptional regulator [Romeria aff. gracilis LEGE 07310]